MAGFNIRIEIDEEEARRNLSALLERMADPRPFYENVGEQIQFSVIERFQSETAPDGTPWTPLRPATIASRLRRKKSAQGILRDSGAMRTAITHEVAGDGVRIGVASGIAYGAIHQFGGTIDMPARAGKIFRRQFADGSFGRRFAKRKNKTSVATDVQVGAHQITIPARPFLGLSPQDEADIIEIARRWLDVGEGAGRSAGR